MREKLPTSLGRPAIKPDKPGDLFRDAETASSDFNVAAAGDASFFLFVSAKRRPFRSFARSLAHSLDRSIDRSSARNT